MSSWGQALAAGVGILGGALLLMCLGCSAVVVVAWL